MDFTSKNFGYVSKKFGEFLDQIESGKRLYLRSLSSEKPASLPAEFARDFPSLASEFHLPPELAFASENAHSSPLRISGPVAMWLHYDVSVFISVHTNLLTYNRLWQMFFARYAVRNDFFSSHHLILRSLTLSRNLLAHISTFLKASIMLHQQSSSRISGFEKQFYPFERNLYWLHAGIHKSDLNGAHPYEALLQPGDILLIPPMWLHAASPSSCTSISVNVFFRNLKEGYAAGKDVYGNRDLQAYEKGRQDIAKIIKSFDGLPPDIRGFYLKRLAREFKQKVSWVAVFIRHRTEKLCKRRL